MPVISSTISEVGHKDDILYIAFQNGKTYAYAPVSVQTFDALTHAESVGKYFHKHIKGNSSLEYRETYL